MDSGLISQKRTLKASDGHPLKFIMWWNEFTAKPAGAGVQSSAGASSLTVISKRVARVTLTASGSNVSDAPYRHCSLRPAQKIELAMISRIHYTPPQHRDDMLDGQPGSQMSHNWRGEWRGLHLCTRGITSKEWRNGMEGKGRTKGRQGGFSFERAKLTCARAD
ncbi:hypothetical protein C8J57DRAFT_1470330 [Mycena rebaudengoi]|nr:hypothetical protein C8J57DRAFT_1470330 [Mycena rebaudengoi]